MKMNTLEDVYTTLRDETHQIYIPPEIATKARVALEKMFKLTT